MVEVDVVGEGALRLRVLVCREAEVVAEVQPLRLLPVEERMEVVRVCICDARLLWGRHVTCVCRLAILWANAPSCWPSGLSVVVVEEAGGKPIGLRLRPRKLDVMTAVRKMRRRLRHCPHRQVKDGGAY